VNLARRRIVPIVVSERAVFPVWSNSAVAKLPPRLSRDVSRRHVRLPRSVSVAPGSRRAEQDWLAVLPVRERSIDSRLSDHRRRARASGHRVPPRHHDKRPYCSPISWKRAWCRCRNRQAAPPHSGRLPPNISQEHAPDWSPLDRGTKFWPITFWRIDSSPHLGERYVESHREGEAPAESASRELRPRQHLRSVSSHLPRALSTLFYRFGEWGPSSWLRGSPYCFSQRRKIFWAGSVP